MNATKRKFNALLNGIGNKSSTSLSSKEVNNDANSIKKRRTTPTNVTTPRRISSLSTIKHKKPASVTAGIRSTPDEPPKYAPWDRVEFLRRLRTFAGITDWTPKPRRVDEVEWAKRGWVCKGGERVRCVLCNVEILVKLNKREVEGKEEDVLVAEEIESALLDKYSGLIVDSHSDDCLWRMRGCDDAIYKLPLNHAPTTIQTICERYNELRTRSETLPYIFNLRSPPELDLEAVLKSLPKDFFNTTNEEPSASAPDINRVALMMSLCGWQGHSHGRLGPQLGSVSCQACFRVLGLWLFKSKELNERGEEVIGAAMNCLDVVNEHREYCPWRNPVTQNGCKTANSETSLLAGWEMVLRVLKNDHYLKQGGDTEFERPQTSDENGFDQNGDGDEKSVREAKDKERWARLRRVKSLFDIKKKIQKSGDEKRAVEI